MGWNDQGTILWLKELQTSVGTLVLGSTSQGLCLLDFKYRKSYSAVLARVQRLIGGQGRFGTSPFIEQAEEELLAYLRGELSTFTVPLDLRGSPFQLLVWNALLEVGYGETVSYAEVATRIGRPTATRAVANANGQNGIAIIIPCHRVIGSDGSLTGYGGGLAVKKKLLELEGSYPRKRTRRPLQQFFE